MALQKEQNIKELLKEFNSIRAEIKELNKKIRKYESEEGAIAFVEGSQPVYPYSKIPIKVIAENTEIGEKLKENVDILKERIVKLMTIQSKLEQFISEIPTSKLRRIFEYKYIYQYSWAKIAYILGENNTPDSVRKEHDRYFKKI